jgi:signal transduction histidine kinase
MLRRLKIRTKLMLLMVVPLVALAITALVVAPTFQRVKVGGPEYDKIVESKDLVADVLPPPEFIVESYLTVLQINAELAELTGNTSADQAAVTARISELEVQLNSLREDYLAKNQYWQAHLSFADVRRPLLQDSYQAATNFYTVVNNEFLPAVAQHNQAAAQRVTIDKLEPIYQQHRTAIEQTVKLATDQSKRTEDHVSDIVSNRVTILIGALAVLVIAWLYVGFRVRRAISRPVRDLTAAANNVATVELPRVVDAIQTTPDGVEVDGLDPVTVETADELADLAHAFNAMQKTAVDLASEQARIRRNVSEMFVNLGRRNQSLLNRTLSFISELERQEKDPDTLDDLFRLDHLTTRMRRNAESLLVLAGSEPARTWSRPVELGNVVRAALSEIEAYDRVDYDELDAALLRGVAVADVAHLIAELVENATTFSPPTTRVQVIGRRQADGYQISVIDEGIGMTDAEIDEANHRIDELTRFDLAPSKVLGLYVVGRLAARHGISVRLVESPADGITAKVRLPLSLLEVAGDRPAEPDLAVVGGRADHEDRVAEVMRAVSSAPSRLVEPPVDVPAPSAHAGDFGSGLIDPGLSPLGPADTGPRPARPRPTTPAKPNLPSATMKPLASAPAPAPAVAPTPPPAPPAPPAPTPVPPIPAPTPVAEVEALTTPAPIEGPVPTDVLGQPDDGSARRLTKRVRGAQMPDTGPLSHADSGRAASADEVRSALANFQTGVTRARVGGDAVPADEPIDVPAPLEALAAPLVVPVVEAAPEPPEAEPAQLGIAAPSAVTTSSGLKKRVRGAQLPDTGPATPGPDAGRPSSADEIRSALSSFQLGVRRATDAASDTTDDD